MATQQAGLKTQECQHKPICYLYWKESKQHELSWGPGFSALLQKVKYIVSTLDSGINIGVRLLIFEKKLKEKKRKNDRNALFDVKMN